MLGGCPVSLMSYSRRTQLSTSSGRSIATHEARQIPRNSHVLVRNPHSASAGKRRLLIGRTDGGRVLTLVIEQTIGPTTWLIVTGWDSSPRERRLLMS
jgi:hypothetical protein